jgi:hypothetical protein
MTDLTWQLIALGTLLHLRNELKFLANAIIFRINHGSEIVTPFGTLKSIPPDLSKKNLDTVGEDPDKANTPPAVEELLQQKNYPPTITNQVYLIHATKIVRQRTPSRTGLYQVRVWIEAENSTSLSQIKRVSYRLHDEFPKQVVSNTVRADNFELWLTAYGEFNLVAYVEFKDGSGQWLTRFLDLPGRPPE